MRKRLMLVLSMTLIVMMTHAINVTPVANLKTIEVTFVKGETAETYGGKVQASIDAESAAVPTSGLTIKVVLGEGTTTADFTNEHLLQIKREWTKVAGVDLSALEGFKVTATTNFSNWDFFSQIILPAGALDTKIPANAFRNCRNLIQLKVGDDVNSFDYITEVEQYAFTDAFSIEARTDDQKVSLNLPNCVRVGMNAFENTTYLTNVTLSSATETIGVSAFANSGITVFPVVANNTPMTVIEANSFRNCDGLTTVNIPCKVTTVNVDAFAECDNLIAYTVCPANTDYAAIDGILTNYDQTEILICPTAKSAGTTMDISGSEFSTVTKIHSGAFANSKATKIILPASLTYISEHVFTGSFAEEIVIGSKVTHIDGTSFNDANHLKKITGSSSDANCYTTQNGILYKNNASGQIETLIRVPEGMIQSDFDTAMASWPSTLTTLAESSFKECVHLTTISLPENITEFRTHAFAGCTGLHTITLPRDLTKFGDAPFQFCSALTNVEIGNNTYFTKSDEGLIYGAKDYTGADAKTLYLFPAGMNVAKPHIDRDTKVIAAEAFAYSEYVEEIKIPQGVHTIESGAFHATKAQTIIIPHSVTSVGAADVFAGCQYLTKIYWLPEKILLYNEKTVGTGDYTNNMFYQAKVNQIDVYVSNEYTDKHPAINNNAETNLVDAYQQLKGNGVGANVGIGDCKSVTGIYHRALTEDCSTGAALGNEGLYYTNPDYANTTSENAYQFITLYRDFTAKEGEVAEPFYTLVLPVSMTAEQVTETFGEGTKMWKFDGRNERVLNFATTTTITAGEPVVIRPTYRATSYLIDMRGNTENAIAVNDGNAVGDGTVKDNCPVEGGSYTYKFVATYRQGDEAPVPAYSYYIANEVGKDENDIPYAVIKYTKKNMKFKKGLRGYISCPDENPNSASVSPAKGISMMSFDGEVTGIETIDNGQWTVDNGQWNDNAIYSLDGRKVANGNIVNGKLPKGIYIIGGKKTVVR